MTRSFTTAIAIVALLAMTAPAVQAGQMINVAPKPPVNLAANVTRPRVQLPAVTPRPEVSRVRVPVDEDEANEDAPAGEDAPDRAETPEAVRQALAPRARLPPGKPDRSGQLANAGGAGPDVSLDLGQGLGPDGGDAPGAGAPSLGTTPGGTLRDRFADLADLERLEEIERLRRFEEEGGLRAGDRAFAGEADPCGPGGLSAGMNLKGVGCGGGSEDESGSGFWPEGGDVKQGHGMFPMHPRSGRRGDPRPGFSRDTEQPGGFTGSGDGSARSRAGLKDFGQGRVSQDGACGRIPGGYGTVTGCFTGADGTTHATGHNERDYGYDTWEVSTSEDSFWLVVERHNEDGETIGYYQRSEQEYGGKTRVVEEWQDAEGETIERRETVKRNDPDDEPDDTETAGGEAGQPNPTGSPGGGNGADCLVLGIRCGLAEQETRTWKDEVREWSRSDGGRETLTPREIMEMVGQPVPTEPWSRVAGAAADAGVLGIDSSIVGLTPPCTANPGGCGGASAAEAESGASVGAAFDLGVVGIDMSIVGLTPPCSADPAGCGARGGSAAGAAFERAR